MPSITARAPWCAQEILQKYEPRASVVPAHLDLTDCPYMWPHCTQPLYAGAMPLMFNATVLNGMGLTGAAPPSSESCIAHSARSLHDCCY